MTNSASLKFDDNDVDDDELLAACADDNVSSNKIESVIPIGDFKSLNEKYLQ